ERATRSRGEETGASAQGDCGRKVSASSCRFAPEGNVAHKRAKHTARPSPNTPPDAVESRDEKLFLFCRLQKKTTQQVKGVSRPLPSSSLSTKEVHLLRYRYS
ncbi:unnamed protein product, partial [Scytosiphon promiscuus]